MGKKDRDSKAASSWIAISYHAPRVGGRKARSPILGRQPMPTVTERRPPERVRDKLSLLRNHPLFGDLPPAVIEHLGSYMKTRKVARGTAIFAKGDPGTGLMGVLSGMVKVSVASTEGKDIVLNIFHEGEIFGEIALLDGRPRTADATAMSDCELILIERRGSPPGSRKQPRR